MDDGGRSREKFQNIPSFLHCAKRRFTDHRTFNDRIFAPFAQNRGRAVCAVSLCRLRIRQNRNFDKIYSKSSNDRAFNRIYRRNVEIFRAALQRAEQLPPARQHSKDPRFLHCRPHIAHKHRIYDAVLPCGLRFEHHKQRGYDSPSFKLPFVGGKIRKV